MGDLRVPMGPIFDAFGLAVTVTRPAPDVTPVETRGVWVVPLDDPRLIGTDFQRREPRRVMALERTGLSTLPRGTVVAAPEQAGDAARPWKVDGLERVEPDAWRAILVPGSVTS